MERTERIFELADRNLNCNTAYPVFKYRFNIYSKDEDIFKDVNELSFYIHVPFCKQLCSFCEYTRFLQGNDRAEEQYLELVEKQAEEFLKYHDVRKLYGFDIGGGTPTALSERNFEKLLDLQMKIEASLDKVHDYEKSIEISFSTITDSKIGLIASHDFHRVSAGMQSISKKLLDENNRIYSSFQRMLDVRKKLQQAGIEKFNIDLMYGLPNQESDSFDATIEAIQRINPEQVTLYETRYNNNDLNSSNITRALQYNQYEYLYDKLTNMGYLGRFGKNTFTRTSDEGVSSYLKYRMRDCIPYKGFGISAQSMSWNGLSYGIFKNSSETYMPTLSAIREGSNYILPREEIAAKYISIGMYNGSFSLKVLAEILGQDPFTFYYKAWEFLRGKNWHTIDKNRNEFTLTKEGFRYYGAINALFWSKLQQEALLTHGGRNE